MIIIDAIKNGLDFVVKNYDLNIKEFEDRISLNYSANSTKYDPIVEECRGLILQKDSWKILCRSFTGERHLEVIRGFGFIPHPRYAAVGPLVDVLDPEGYK